MPPVTATSMVAGERQGERYGSRRRVMHDVAPDVPIDVRSPSSSLVASERSRTRSRSAGVSLQLGWHSVRSQPTWSRSWRVTERCSHSSESAWGLLERFRSREHFNRCYTNPARPIRELSRWPRRCSASQRCRPVSFPRDASRSSCGTAERRRARSASLPVNIIKRSTIALIPPLQLDAPRRGCEKAPFLVGLNARECQHLQCRSRYVGTLSGESVMAMDFALSRPQSDALPASRALQD